MNQISKEELIEMINGGAIFEFCASVALNKGYRSVMVDRKPCEFTIGKYNVKFMPDNPIHFELVHSVYFARIIHAYYGEAHFIGDDEKEVIDDLLKELESESNELLTETK